MIYSCSFVTFHSQHTLTQTHSATHTTHTHSHIHLYTRRLCWRTCFRRFLLPTPPCKKPPQPAYVRVGRPQQDENAKHPLTAAVALPLCISTFNFAVVEQGTHTHSRKTVRAAKNGISSCEVARREKLRHVPNVRTLCWEEAGVVFCSPPFDRDADILRVAL